MPELSFFLACQFGCFFWHVSLDAFWSDPIIGDTHLDAFSDMSVWILFWTISWSLSWNSPKIAGNGKSACAIAHFSFFRESRNLDIWSDETPESGV